MGVKSQHKIQAIQEVRYPQSGRRDEIPDIDVLQIVTELEKVSTGFSEVVTRLERSDSFLQRLSVINSQIERQLINK